MKNSAGLTNSRIRKTTAAAIQTQKVVDMMIPLHFHNSHTTIVWVVIDITNTLWTLFKKITVFTNKNSLCTCLSTLNAKQ
ncbi:MAG: hypothetical protein DRP47_05670 [Candidatus Zixiibacteriota bacterium]|nr:MAG: hypothetical protein DRP47_05670 [candidate division Zixibacteria bacterium]